MLSPGLLLLLSLWLRRLSALITLHHAIVRPAFDADTGFALAILLLAILIVPV